MITIGIDPHSRDPDLGRIFTWGVAAENVASVELELANGETIPTHLVERPEGIDAPLNFFWA